MHISVVPSGQSVVWIAEVWPDLQLMLADSANIGIHVLMPGLCGDCHAFGLLAEIIRSKLFLFSNHEALNHSSSSSSHCSSVCGNLSRSFPIRAHLVMVTGTDSR